MRRPSSRVSIPHLQSWRVSRGLTLDALAKQAGVSRMTIFNLEKDRAQANPVTLWKIAQALGISRKQLLEESPAEGVAERGEEVEENGRAVA